MKSVQPYSRHRLPSGATALLIPRQDTEAVTLFVVYPVGSRYETPSVAGVSHFIEHLMFKGTKKRPTTLHISRELDGVGAEYNAFTSKDHTAYYVKVQSHRLELAVDVLSDMLRNSKFDPKEIQRERKVIVEEINMYEDNPLYSIEDLFETLLFGGNHPLGRDTIGTREVIRSVSRISILRYRKRFYAANTPIIVVAGKFEQAAVLRTLKTAFAGSTRLRPVSPPKYRRYPTGLRVSVREKKTEQVQLGLGFPALPYLHPDLPALSLLTVALGGSMSSRLFIQIRERLGLCYSIRATTNVFSDAGALFIQAGLDRARLDLAITAILKELANVRARGITPKELLRAKDYTRGKLVLDLEDSESLANFYGRQLVLTGRMETPAEKLAKLQRVTGADIRRVAKRIIVQRSLALSAIGPRLDRAKLLATVRRSALP
jgi:predicted Zn-dependent peptidase